MEDIKKMLRAVINGQSAMKQDLLKEIGKVETKIEKRIHGLESETRSGFKKVNGRLGKLGSQIAYLEDDAPTRKEHERLENRMKKVEQKLASF